MTARAAIADHRDGDLLGDYEGFVDSLGVNSAQRSRRKLAARRFLERHGDLEVWMTRPTATPLG